MIEDGEDPLLQVPPQTSEAENIFKKFLSDGFRRLLLIIQDMLLKEPGLPVHV
jgi:hypothetical protein